ncbi:MAG: 2-oxoacid:acceptor oxidoreductase subunit alpha [Gammaproteobacteria bacterium]|nr:MAG: 2-oxoacid:acceptor oxidoreductase subunit alpha [Gammaproteobacteria bacterium]
MGHSERAREGPADSPELVESVIIRFAGDSGDGIQTTGALFTQDSAVSGHDISTLPDFPAEIRAPAGTVAGVSSFQLNFSSRDIHTPGDRPDVLVAMNPAALKTHLADLIPGGMVIVNEDAFTRQSFKKAGIKTDPREDGTLEGHAVHSLPVTSVTMRAVEPVGLGKKNSERCKNMFTLGVVCWLYDRDTDVIEKLIDAKYASSDPKTAEANRLALRAGHSYADTVRLVPHRYHVDRAKLPPGKYRRITGNSAAALGFVVASKLADRPLVFSSYPITPASDILHELARLRNFGIKTGQFEDEIAAMGAAIGAAYGGALGLTATSGPGVCLKSEAIGLAVMTELPVVIVDVQRGGPSTGLPTKTEQADLLQAMFGRNGESPVAIVAPQSPSDCFDMAIEAFRIAIRHMCPVFFLSDGYLANGSEPWRVPSPDELPEFRARCSPDADSFQPYGRDPDTLARPWVTPGMAGLEHRIGGLEKQDGSGEVCYEPGNHERMVRLRAGKIQRIANDIPELKVFGPDRGDLLVIGWGSTYGAIRTATERSQSSGASVACVQLRYLNPFPSNLGTILDRFDQVLVPELNSGQLRLLLRAGFLKDVQGLNKIQGQPFRTWEVQEKIDSMLGLNVRTLEEGTADVGSSSGDNPQGAIS